MTHTQESNFVRIAEGLDVEPLLELLDAKPELWKEIEERLAEEDFVKKALKHKESQKSK